MGNSAAAPKSSTPPNEVLEDNEDLEDNVVDVDTYLSEDLPMEQPSRWLRPEISANEPRGVLEAESGAKPPPSNFLSSPVSAPKPRGPMDTPMDGRRRPMEAATPSTAVPSVLGRPVGSRPLDSQGVTEPSFSMDAPDGLQMPPGSEFVAGTVLPDSGHGYTGERDELGQRHGDGVQLFPDGRRYSGQFEVNTFQGAAIMEWPDGHRYTGQYDNNHKSGYGFFLWPDGRFYDGQWRMGQRHGHGQYIAAESYVGDYYEGFRHGDGVLTWPDGKRYAGQFFRGALHGSAVMSWPDGRRYLGQYVDNQKQGEGLFYWPDGRLYEGQWKKGLRHGESRFVDNSGEEQVGTWHKDRLVSSTIASEPGVKDPFCVPPPSLLGKRKPPAAFKPQLEGIAESQEPHEPADVGAGAFPPDQRRSLSMNDVQINIQGAEGEQPETSGQDVPHQRTHKEISVDQAENSLTVNEVEHKLFELHELREMPHGDLRDHANRLHGTFGHLSSPVPANDHGLLGWIYEVQARHLRPLYDAAVYEVPNFQSKLPHRPETAKTEQGFQKALAGAPHKGFKRKPKQMWKVDDHVEGEEDEEEIEDLGRAEDDDDEDEEDDRFEILSNEEPGPEAGADAPQAKQGHRRRERPLRHGKGSENQEVK